jgi:hypothetical protein
MALSAFPITGNAQTTEVKPPAKEEPKKDPRTEEYEKAVKDLTKLEGNFTLYRRKKEILLELPEANLGKLFLVQAAFNTGFMSDTAQAGFPLGANAVDAFRFEKNDDTVLLVRPNISVRWDKSDPLAKASERSFPEATIATFRIEATNVEKKLLLVNFTNLFYGDFLQLPDMMQALAGPYGLERDKSGPEWAKSYPDNTVVRMKFHYFSPRGGIGQNPILGLLGSSPQIEDDRSIPFKVTYNLWWRQDSGYMPRIADPRVGFFTEDFYSVSRFAQDDRTERYIFRWNLKKKDPKVAISEPVKPVVWYVDSTVPDAYRQAVKDGILFWNKAFEPLGFKNAVQVLDAPKDDPDWDHADARHNVVRWAMSEDASYAIALARVDPFTGEVLNASVNLDAGMAQFAVFEHNKIAAPANNLDRALAVFTREHESKHPENCSQDNFLWDGESAIAKAAYGEKLHSLGWTKVGCSYAKEKMMSAAEGWAALKAGGILGVSSTKYAQDFIRATVAHEIGHTFGLRHNFIASTLNTTAELANDSLMNSRGIASSVMDYTPVNIQAVLKGRGVFFDPGIGSYDKWAIQYGYTDIPGAATPIGEKHALANIAGQSGTPGHRYMTDESADGWDPAVVRHDFGKDPLTYSTKMLEAMSRIEHYAINELPKPGEPFSKRTELLNLVMRRLFREGRNMARFVGGIHASRSFKGDPGAAATLAPVSAQEQRLAVKQIVRFCLSPSAFHWPESVMTSFSPDANDELMAGYNAPLRQTIASSQAMMYAQIMSDSTLRRIAENQFKWNGSKNGYTIDEHFSTILGSVFSDIGSGNRSVPLRRDLQRFAVQGLIVQAGAGQGQVLEDVRMLASDALRRLRTRYDSASKNSKLDGMTAVYLRDTSALIGRFLDRKASGIQ